MAFPPMRPARRRGRLSAVLLALLVAAPATATPPSPALRARDPWVRVAGPQAPAVRGETLLIAGDIASCSSDDDDRTASLIDALPGLVMTAGDNTYPSGAEASFHDCYDPTWGRFLDRTRPVPGNHDWMVSGAAGYFGYFGTRAGPRGRGYYAFSLGSWRVYALASDCGDVGGCGRGSAQRTWLEADLARHPRACVLAVWHVPRFSSGPHGDSKVALPLLRMLYRARAELVVNGHDHVYERFAPATPGGTRDAARGVRQFIVGTGGAPLYSFSASRVAHSVVRSSSSHGVLRLTLGKGEYAWSFLPVAGATFTDTGRGTCH